MVGADFVNIDYMSQGYNIFFGNALPTNAGGRLTWGSNPTHPGYQRRLSSARYSLSGTVASHPRPAHSLGAVDPGYSDHAGESIWAFSYSKKRTTGMSDGAYNLPDGIYALHDVGCKLSYTASSSTTTKSYQDELSVSAKVSPLNLPSASSFIQPFAPLVLPRICPKSPPESAAVRLGPDRGRLRCRVGQGPGLGLVRLR